jgi:transcriptional regulator with XRE-family HTH domain
MSQMIHDKIRKIRDYKGFTQDYMAEKLSLSQKAYSKIERGEVKLDWNRINEIALLLEVSPVDLVSNDYIFTFNNCSQSGKIETINNLSTDLKETYEKLIKEMENTINSLKVELNRYKINK